MAFASSFSQDSIITFQAQIIGILNRIHSDHLLLSASIDNSSDYYSTTLLGIQPEKNTLVLDELYPADGNEKLAIGSEISIKTRLRGIDTDFSCQVSQVEHENGYTSYYANIPQELAYHQKRQQYRAPSGLHQQVYLELNIPSKRSITVFIADISSTGIGLVCDTSDVSLLNIKQLIKDVRILLPGYPPFHVDLEIRQLQKKNNKQHIAGTKFIGLTQRNQKQLQGYVASVDRQLRQKYK